jgi:hypothetical protein
MTGFIVSVFLFRNRVSSKEAFEGLELGEGKLSRPVLRGPGGRKAAWLLGSNLRAWHRLWTDDGQRRRVGSYQEVGTDRSTFRCHFAVGKIRGDSVHKGRSYSRPENTLSSKVGVGQNIGNI